jgi:serine/threonine protein kinase
MGQQGKPIVILPNGDECEYHSSSSDDEQQPQGPRTGSYKKLQTATILSSRQQIADCVLKQSAYSDKHIQRIKRSLSILERLKGVPGIINYLACVILKGKKEEKIHLLQKLYEGDLVDLFYRCQGNISPQTWHTIGSTMLKTLSSMHERGIVHRDIKPENVLYQYETQRLRLALCDLDFIEDIENLNNPSAVGTPAYTSPEYATLQLERIQAKRHGAEPPKITPEIMLSNDVWAAGLTLYVLHSQQGSFPFPLSEDNPLTQLKTLSKLLEDNNSPFPNPDKSTPEGVIQSMLAVNPKIRPTMAEASRLFHEAISSPVDTGE